MPVRRSGFTKRIFPKGTARLASAFALAALAFTTLTTTVNAAVHIEGRLADMHANGRFDLDVAIRSINDESMDGSLRNLQVIRMAMVSVADGRFQLTLDTGLEEYALDGLFIEVLVRPFETHGPFRPAFVSRVTSSDNPAALAYQALPQGPELPR